MTLSAGICQSCSTTPREIKADLSVSARSQQYGLDCNVTTCFHSLYPVSHSRADPLEIPDIVCDPGAERIRRQRHHLCSFAVPYCERSRCRCGDLPRIERLRHHASTRIDRCACRCVNRCGLSINAPRSDRRLSTSVRTPASSFSIDFLQ